MKINGTDIGFIGLVLAAMALLFAISGGRKTRPVPNTPPHQVVYLTAYRNAPPQNASMFKHVFFRAEKKSAEVYCEQCHNNQKVLIPPNHPSKKRCLLCHGLQPLKS